MKVQKAYVEIYFLGISSLIMYNSAAGILRALGDSRHPLYYLIVSSVINIILDLIFVVGFGFGIRGAATATIIGQSISTILSYRILLTSNDEYRVRIKDIKFDKKILKQILIIGIPSGLQSSISAFSNVILQSGVNSFGSIAMAGSGAFSRSQGFLFKPISSFAQSLTTFTSQNLGAKEYDRVKKGVKFGMTAITSLAVIISLVLYIFAPSIISLFSKDPDVIKIGVLRAHYIAPGLVLLAISHTLISIFRGAGKSFVPMVVMLVFFCIFRIVFVTIGLSLYHDIRIVFVVYPLSWILGTIVFIIYYFKVDWMNNKLN
jgi:putative MATE family efflux protein